MEFEKEAIDLIVDDAKIESFSRMIRADLPGFAFPPEYLDFLHAHNGGRPTRNQFNAMGQLHHLDFFLNFGSLNDSVDIDVRRLNVSVFWSAIEDRLSIDLVPFAVTPSGDALCFCYQDDLQPPTVVLWSHEESREDAPVTRFVASDFHTFCNSLY